MTLPMYPHRVRIGDRGRVAHAAECVPAECWPAGYYVRAACGELGVSDGEHPPVTALPSDAEVTCRHCQPMAGRTYPGPLPVPEREAEEPIAFYVEHRCPLFTYDANGVADKRCGAPSAPDVPYRACADHADKARRAFRIVTGEVLGVSNPLACPST